jgi:hypothetical protein
MDPHNPYQAAPDTPHATATPPRRRRWLLPVIAAVVLLAAGVGLTAYLLRTSPVDRDPAGARACEMLASWQTGRIAENKVVAAAALAEQASKSATESIRKTAGEPVFDDEMMRSLRSAGYTAGNMRLANLRDLHAACEGEGTDMPPWVES